MIGGGGSPPDEPFGGSRAPDHCGRAEFALAMLVSVGPTPLPVTSPSPPVGGGRPPRRADPPNVQPPPNDVPPGSVFRQKNRDPIMGDFFFREPSYCPLW